MKKKFHSPLEIMGDLANVLEAEVFVDGTSTVQKRAFRDAADTLRSTLEATLGDLTPPILVSFYLGALTEATLDDEDSPLSALLATTGLAPKKTGPKPHLSVIIAYLARDMIAGERVA